MRRTTIDCVVSVLFDIKLHAQTDGEFLAENGFEVLRDLGIAQRCDMLALIEHGDFDSSLANA